MNTIEESFSDRTTPIGPCVDGQHDCSCKSLSIVCTLTLQRYLLIETGWNGLQETRSIFDSLRCKEKRRVQLPLCTFCIGLCSCQVAPVWSSNPLMWASRGER